MTQSSEGTTIMRTLDPSPDDIRDLLRAGAEHINLPNVRAAVHLLVSTGVAAADRFIQQLDVRYDDQQRPYGVLRQWGWATSGEATKYIPEDERKLLEAAYGLATGNHVDLRRCTAGLNTSYARRMAEAMLIATGAGEFYRLEPTEALAGV